MEQSNKPFSSWPDLVSPDELKEIPFSHVFSNNGISIVYGGEDNWVYKRSIPFLIENELWCYQQMYDSGFVPRVERYDKYTIRTEYLGENKLVKDKEKFLSYRQDLFYALRDRGIRHGDITKYAIIVKDDKPYIIDFAESRLINDPRPDKRPEGDKYWIWRTFEELCNGSTSQKET